MRPDSQWNAPPHAEWLESCESTNDLLRERAEAGAVEGSWIAAAEQRSGRGQRGRRWMSVAGNLHLSVLIRGVDRLRDERVLGWLSLVVGAAVVRALNERFAGLGATLKWPNDVWVGDQKLAGLLCEASADWAVIGVGLNAAQAPTWERASQPADGVLESPRATSLRDQGIATEPGAAAGAPLVLAPLLASAVVEAARLLREQGLGQVRGWVEAVSRLRAGSRVSYVDPPTEQTESRLRYARVEGLGSGGELLVIDEQTRDRLALTTAQVRPA